MISSCTKYIATLGLAFIIAATCALSLAETPGGPVTVSSVFDGDTIVVVLDGRELTVRLIGVDTPETGRPDTPVQFYGPEASDFTRRALLGKQVRLEFESPDRPGGAIDKYGRTLAYVITAEGTNFNLELVRLGYGRAYTKYPFQYQRDFEKAERAARRSGLGIWDKNKRAAWSDPVRRGTVIGNSRSRIYHLPGQEGYDKVREKNRIYFPTEEEAQKAGYRKARN
ncbi:MAG: thermonuclease family protein [Nitrospirota bacterium]